MRTLIVIATYNEASNVGTLIPEILKQVPTSTVLVVDDNSPDGTSDIVRALGTRDNRVQLLTRATERGYGQAMTAGIQRGLEGGYDVIATLDADFSHDPADLPRLIEALQSADVAIGSRYIGGIRVLNWDVRRLLLSLGANAYIRVLTGLHCIDCTSGFRAYRGDVLRRFTLRRVASTGYAFLPELLFELGSVRIAEVPVCYTERRVGTSKMRKRVVVEAVVRPWILFGRRMLHLRSRKRLPVDPVSDELTRRAEPARPPAKAAVDGRTRAGAR
jgi:dolichol-phosphate mannosyltransferase